MKKASEAEVDKTSTSTSKAGPSKQPDPIIHPNPRTSDHSDAQPDGNGRLWSLNSTTVHPKCTVRSWLQALGSSIHTFGS